MQPERKRGPKPEPKNAATPLAGVPPRPEGMDAAARAHWKRLTGMLAEAGLLSLLDGPALALYMSLWARWRKAEAKVREEGEVITAVNGYKQANVWLNISVQCLKDMRTLLTAFGLTPAARTKLNIAQPEEVDAEWEELE